MSHDELEAKSLEILYNESKAAVEVIDQLLIRYRANTITVLALGTGAATLFGLSRAPRDWPFFASLISYAVGVVAAFIIFWPKRWRDGIYDSLKEASSKTPPQSPKELHRKLAHRYREALGHARVLRTRVAYCFWILIAATASVVGFAGIAVSHR